MVVLRITVVYLRDRTKIALNGELVGECADRLPKTVDQCCPSADVEIDLDGITCADRAGEQALLALWRAHRRFVCTSLFPHALCQGLGIPLEGGKA